MARREALLVAAEHERRHHKERSRLSLIERCEVCDRVRDALAGADIGQDEGLAFDVAVLQAAWEEMHREAKQTRGAVEALAKVRDYCAGMLAAFEGDDGYWNDLPRAEELLRDVLTRAGGQ